MQSKFKKVLALLLSAGILAVSAAAEQKNLLMNSDFNTATNEGYPDFWDGASGWLPGTHKLISEGFIQGTKSMLLTVKGKNEVKFFTGNFGWSPGKEGTHYTFSVYLKADPAGQKVKIGSSRFKQETITVGQEWKRYSVSGKLDNLTGFKGRFLNSEIILQPDVGEGKLYINAPMLYQGETEVPYAKRENAKEEAHAAEPLEKSLVAFWRFDHEENDKIKDHSGRGLHGKIVGTYQIGETNVGKGMLFDGNVFVTVPYTSKLDVVNGEVTVELLLKPEPEREMPIFTHGMQWGGYELRVAYGKYRPMFSAWKGFLTQPALPETVHLVMSYKKPYAEFYLNGNPETPELLDVVIQKECGKRAFIIGGWEKVKDSKKGYVAVPGFKGVINYIKIYSRRISPQEAQQLYNQRQENCK